MSDGVSVVVPVYNGAPTLSALVDQVGQTLSPLGGAFEIILVNDGSADGSWEMILRLAGENAHVRGLNLMRNCGQHAATLAGVRAAKFPLCVTIDDDLQNPPQEIPRLLEELQQGFDVVYGSPREGHHGLLRNAASRLTKVTMALVMGVRAAHHASSFRAFRTHLRDAMLDYRGTHPSVDVLLSWGTTRFSAVTVEHRDRETGHSNYSLFRLVTHALNMATGFSALPLRIATVLGFLFTLFGFAVLVYVVGRYFISGSSVPGFPFLASLVAIFSGTQMFALGIFGEYLARMHFRLMDRPTYTIQSDTDASGEDGNGE